MEEYKNKTSRPIDFKIYEAILKCEEILKVATAKNIFQVILQPWNQDEAVVYGITFVLDMREGKEDAS